MMPKVRRRAKPAARFQRLPSRSDVDAILISFAIPRALQRRVKAAGLAFNYSLSHIARLALSEWLDRNPAPPEKGQR
jgi:hypothetical protein